MAEHGFWTFAQRDPSKLALVAPDGREWTRGELLADCNRIVHGLRALGLEHGDTVAVCATVCALAASTCDGIVACFEANCM